MDEPAPDPEALQRMVDQEQSAAGLRSLAEAVVVVRKVLIDGGVDDATADQMVPRFWLHMFPGHPGPLGFMFGGGS